jgi:hypothetical protein
MKSLFLAVIVLGIASLSVLSLPSILSSNQRFPYSSAALSYNPAPANRFHSPLSSMGLIAVADALPAASSLSSTSAQGVSGDLQGVVPSIQARATRFIEDSSYMPQSETSLAVDPNNPSHVVGAFNDGRWFFCPFLPVSNCPSGYTISLSGFTTSSDGGKTVMKSNDIPGISYPSNGSCQIYPNGECFLLSWGDPSVAVSPDGNFFYASLAIDPTSGANGVMITKSDPSLWQPGDPCVTGINTPWHNECWKKPVFVFGNLSAGAVSFEDKDRIAVDTDPSSPFFGSVYISWDHFYPNGTSASFLARCTNDLDSCTMLSGGPKPPISGSDIFADWTTVVVGKDGAVYVTWCNIGTFTTFGPVSCKVASSPPGGNDFGKPHDVFSFMGQGTTMPQARFLIGFASEQFRTASIEAMAVDKSSASNNLYWTIAVCTSGKYYVLPGGAADNPGDCGLSSIIFTSSSDGGVHWSKAQIVSLEAVNVQPFITVDPANGNLYVLYYTTQFDPFNHRIDVVASKSSNEGLTFSQVRITSVSNEPDSDPAYYDYFTPSGFGGSFIVPQYGDYFEGVALHGRLYVLYTANYASELGTLQTDPWLSVLRA